MILIMATIFVLGTLICYSCCVTTGARADKYSKHYFENKEEEEYYGKHYRKE